jgi:Transposase DDE domain
MEERRFMISKEQYIEFLISTPINYTCTHLADHLLDISHDSVTDFLQSQRLTAQSLWTYTQGLIHDAEESFLIVDDSVQEKPHAQAIALVYPHYSGTKHAVVRGIDIVNLVHSSGDGDYYPVDYRIYAPEYAKETKNDYFLAMLKDAFEQRKLRAKYILFDSWYASVGNLKYIHRNERIFYTTLKSNRLVSITQEEGYIHLQDIEWTQERLVNGVLVKLKEVPFLVRLFKIVTKNGDIDWVITNDPTPDLTRSIVRGRNDVRWDVECFHRELKQLTGSEKCQCRSAWAQRNHIACCYQAWLALKLHAARYKKTLYRVKNELLSEYLMRELRNPHIRALINA